MGKQMTVAAYGVTILALGALLSACEGGAGATGAQGITGAAGASGSGKVLLNLKVVGRYSSGRYNVGAAEIVAFDKSSKRLFVINAAAVTIDVINLADPANPVLLGTINAQSEGGSANSVAVRSGVVAVAIESTVKTSPGKVVFYDALTLARLSSVAVGAQPDMVTYSPDGKYVLVANEGEPNAGYTLDPEGSISVIDVSAGFVSPTVATADFNAFNASIATLRAAGVRIYGPGASVARDLEPEYIAVAADGLSARVTLQEANALAVLDLSDKAAPRVTSIQPLKLKDHMAFGNELDPSDRDPTGAPSQRIRNWPVYGMYQPDGIASYQFAGSTFYVTANEGDDRDDFITGGETARVSTLTLDPVKFPNATDLKADAALGRLTVSKLTGDVDGDGDYDQLHVLGGRSFSIWDAAGVQYFDSGSQFEQITARLYPNNFNTGHTTNALEDRSDNKGPEPEGVALGKLSGRTYAFIGLERIGGVMVYDVTNPQNAEFVQYINPRDFTKTPATEYTVLGDLGPEGLEFIAAADSPNGKPLLVVGNEVSGTTAIIEIEVIALP
jgi:hypothetical protein